MARTTRTHTDTASGLGGGQLTETPSQNPGDNASEPDGENAKSSEARRPGTSGAGQDPEEVAERMGSTGGDAGET